MIKRILDIALSIVGIVLTSPIMLLCAFLIRVDSEGNILFRQKRLGLNEKEFDILKFRTMVEDASQIGPTITEKEDPRITQVGGLLRWLKFDELPQLFNILKGEMSFVGPRPEVLSMTKLYKGEERKVFTVRPGIFGPNQITHRDEASMLEGAKEVEKTYEEKILPEKIKVDLAYVKNKNPLKDLELFFGNAFALFFSSIKFRYIFESRRRILFLFFDIAVSIMTYWFAFVLRFEGEMPEKYYLHIQSIAFFIVLIRAPSFIYFGLYQTLWQYLGIQELISIIKAVTVSSIVLPFVPFLTQTEFPPRSVIIMDWLLLIVAIGGSRVIFKITSERLRGVHVGNRKNVMIVGAEDAGELLVREYIRHPSLGYKPIGFVDDDPTKQNVRIHGVKVMGKISQLAQVARVKKADEVIIALSQASGDKIKGIIKKCRELNLTCQIVPQTSALMSAKALPLKLRPVDVSDLLGRELVEADIAGIQSFIKDKKVLVTGAGGSIGSELARIIFQNHPEELILVDNSESSLYNIETDLQTKSEDASLACYLQNVCDADEMEHIFMRHKPDVIYHAAAYKHVPLVEMNHRVGVMNNIVGTKVVADLAKKYGAERFILISTDKAINPSSLMGVTKRVAEMYTQSLNGKNTHFMAVRFGNVFNSQGSVVPLFKKQIEAGGPITVTDENVTRYFMDISEAVFLILQASIIGKGSEIFVLDMGEAVRIKDLARSLVQLMGFSKESIPIKYTGLRPGEKLHEEIELSHEQAQPTSHSKIRIWKSSTKRAAAAPLNIEDLLRLVHENVSREEIIQKLKLIVPEYHPWKYDV